MTKLLDNNKKAKSKTNTLQLITWNQVKSDLERSFMKTKNNILTSHKVNS